MTYAPNVWRRGQEAGYAEGAAAERARILAIIKEQARLYRVEGHLESMTACVNAIIAIERREHAPRKPEEE